MAQDKFSKTTAFGICKMALTFTIVLAVLSGWLVGRFEIDAKTALLIIGLAVREVFSGAANIVSEDAK